MIIADYVELSLHPQRIVTAVTLSYYSRNLPSFFFITNIITKQCSATLFLLFHKFMYIGHRDEVTVFFINFSTF